MLHTENEGGTTGFWSENISYAVARTAYPWNEKANALTIPPWSAHSIGRRLLSVIIFDLFLTFLTGHSAKWPVQDGVLGHVSPCFLTLSYTLCYGGCNCFFE